MSKEKLEGGTMLNGYNGGFTNFVLLSEKYN